ncbi:MAG: hypothetical protein JJE04_05190 [Acidobacteriia bacterium]|nr:hypothetical protein [Terriglobia bacterium]
MADILSRRLGEFTTLLHGLYLGLLGWLNLYIAREFFQREYTGHMNSMHGFWIAIARLSGGGWWKATWWPYWDGGMPFEYTYAPLVPFASWAWAKAAGISEAAGFLRVSGVVYCAGPLAVYVLGSALGLRPAYAFGAGAAYSLLTGSHMDFLEPHRLYLTAVWDDTPHLAGLYCAVLGVAFLITAWRKGSRRWWAAAALLMAAAMLASLFAITVLAMAGLCFAAAWGPGGPRRALWMAGSAGVCGWMVAGPFASPSLLLQVGRVSQTYPEGRTSWESWAGLAVVFGAGWLVARRWGKPETRFAILMALMMTAPALAQYCTGLNLLPQAGRYKLEMDLVLALVGALACQALLGKVRLIGRVGVCLILIVAASGQVVSHRRFAKQVTQETVIEKTVECRAARWTEKNLPGRRVMFSGSMAPWANAFTGVEQFSGSSFSVAPNLVQQHALQTIYSGTAEEALVWLRAFGVDAVWVPGRQSGEFWKPFPHPEAFAGLLRPLREEQGVVLYEIPRDRGKVEVVWENRNVARVKAQLRRGEELGVPVNYHPGWRAFVGGKEAGLWADKFGLIRMRPGCSGSCLVELRYDGGWELWLLRWLSWITFAALILALPVWKPARDCRGEGRDIGDK